MGAQSYFLFKALVRLREIIPVTCLLLCFVVARTETSELRLLSHLRAMLGPPMITRAWKNHCALLARTDSCLSREGRREEGKEGLLLEPWFTYASQHWAENTCVSSHFCTLLPGPTFALLSPLAEAHDCFVCFKMCFLCLSGEKMSESARAAVPCSVILRNTWSQFPLVLHSTLSSWVLNRGHSFLWPSGREEGSCWTLAKFA